MPEQTSQQNDSAPCELPCDLAVVILNYNTCQLLRDCLHSVQRQRHNLRMCVYVVDNASTDGSAEMVRHEFPKVQLIANTANVGYSAGNNIGLRRLGFDRRPPTPLAELPRYALLLNPDTVVPPGALEAMVRFLDERPTVGVAGPRVRRPDGSLDRACRRSFPTPQVSFYRMVGLSRLFPNSRRFNAYNLEYLLEDAVHPVDSVVGAYMQVRGAAIDGAGLLDESFFMYGEDLDWAKRIKDAGWEVWYNGQVEILHVKEAASSQSAKSRIDFYEAMWLFYRKHYREETNWLLDKIILLGIVGKGGLDVSRHLWRYCRGGRKPPGQRAENPIGQPTGEARPAGATEDKTDNKNEGRAGLDAAESV
jgi:N-acetylglucosaminyl-diphospho-decaprenol L-rhamnosyltransferase